ncbi:CLUMA_CG006994, isoform A [Clunio marinus]|uniref:CLUMA_CG006994, isoform A n=1 Tax=Clunio marinus TaxID=568069 RepID=A0A1J1I122_9DIPT|nr:CLUMA_CG006994, isoform A [Clunio marinus]
MRSIKQMLNCLCKNFTKSFNDPQINYSLRIRINFCFIYQESTTTSEKCKQSGEQFYIMCRDKQNFRAFIHRINFR